MVKIISKLVVFVFLAVFFGTSCASVTTTDIFLVENLTNAEKANALVKKGIDLYNKQLKNGDDFSLLPKIEEILHIALEYDPDNKDAADYLAKTDAFIQGNLSAYSKLIDKNKAKQKDRSDEDDYLLCLYVQKLYELDPDYEGLSKLTREISPLQKKLVEKYLKDGDQLYQQAEKESDADKKYNLAIRAIDLYNKYLRIDPANSRIQGAKERSEKILVSGIKELIVKIESNIPKWYFTASLSLVDKIVYYNKKIDYKMQTEVNDLLYKFYLEWTKFFVDKKQYAQAKTKLKTAVYYKNTPEAEALRKKIDENYKPATTASSGSKSTKPAASSGSSASSSSSSSAASAEPEKTFESWLDDIDEQLAGNNLAEANRLIKETYKIAANDAQKKELEQRQQIIKDKLAVMYEEGVNAYIGEDYKKAIEIFSAIAAIDAGYKASNDYLEKAKAKQKLIESF